jgi:hypothetical protein
VRPVSGRSAERQRENNSLFCQAGGAVVAAILAWGGSRRHAVDVQGSRRLLPAFEIARLRSYLMHYLLVFGGLRGSLLAPATCMPSGKLFSSFCFS